MDANVRSLFSLHNIFMNVSTENTALNQVCLNTQKETFQYLVFDISIIKSKLDCSAIAPNRAPKLIDFYLYNTPEQNPVISSTQPLTPRLMAALPSTTHDFQGHSLHCPMVTQKELVSVRVQSGKQKSFHVLQI